MAIHRRARESGGDPALHYEDETLTFAQLSHRVQQTATILAAGGVQPGDRVAYLGLNSPLFLETLLAALHLGAVFVPLNFRLAGAEVAFALSDSGCHSLVVESGHREVVEALVGSDPDSLPVRRYYLEGKADGGAEDPGVWQGLAGLEGDGTAPDAVAPAERDIALLMYTSGTTGRPKGVILTYGNLWWNQVNVHTAIDIRPRECTLAAAPLFHIGGLNAFTLGTLVRGGPVVLHRRFDPETCLRDVERYRVASMFMVPVMYAALLRCERFAATDLSSLRAPVVAGAPVPPALVTEYAERGVALQQAWGLTETAPFATYLPPHLVRTHPSSAGFAMPCSEVRVVDPTTGSPLDSPGAQGELCVRGPNVTPGYWNDPGATGQVIDADGWFRTGDLGHLDENGLCFVVDRIKDLIISGGENVSPAEVERVLTQLPGVRDVAVVGLPHTKWGQTPVAVLCPDGDAAPTLQEVRDFAASRLARFKLPTRVLCLEALPRNAAGKIDRAAVRASAEGALGPTARSEQFPSRK